MKIAMIGHKRIPGREGGIEVVVEELTTRMAEKGNKVTAYNRHKKGFKCPHEYKGVRIVDVPTIEKKSTDAVVYSFIASIRSLFGKYDIIHYHAIGPSVFLIIPHLFGIKTVVTVHGLNYKTEYIPNGVTIQPEEKATMITEKYGLAEKKYILFLSRVVPGKGLEYLLDAYREVNCDLPLVIAGGTEYVEEFRRMMEDKASKDSRVKMIGFVEGKVLRELYSNAKLFVFPSEAEGMPMCLLEAMSYNCPCLVSDIPENVEVGKNYVQYFESKNTIDLKKQLERCLCNQEIREVNTREYVMENYSWNTVVEETMKLYEKVIE